MGSGIGAYRDIARTTSARVTVDRNADGGTVVRRSSTMPFGRLCAFVKRRRGDQDAIQEENRASVSNFHAALQKTYGRAISDKVFDTHLKAKLQGGSKLSAARISKALDDADSLRFKASIRNERQATRFLSSSAFTKLVGDVLGKRPNDVPDKQLHAMRRVAAKAIQRDPGHFRKLLSRQELADVAATAIRQARQQSEQNFQQRLPNVARLAAQEQGAIDDDYLMSTISRLATDGDTLEAAFWMDEAFGEISRAQDLMSEVPMTHDEIQAKLPDYNAQIGELRRAADDLSKIADHPDPTARAVGAALKADVERVLHQVEEKKAYVQAFDDDRPLSADSVMFAKKAMCESALIVIAKELTDLPADAPPDRARKLVALQASISQKIEREAEAAGRDPSDRTDWAGKATRKAYLADLKAQLEEAGVAGGSALDERMAHAHTVALNRTPWTPTRSTIRFTLNGAQHVAQSDVTPARHVAPENDPLTQSYVKDGLNGVSSESDELADVIKDHALNAATSSLKMGGSTILRGVRHGVHCTRGLEKGSEDRRVANRKHAEETVKLALHGMLNEGGPRRAALLEAARNGQTIDMPITSQSLLTPTDLFAQGKTQWLDQKQAWDDVNAQPMTVQIRDGDDLVDVKVRPKVLAFNFGVNPLAVSAPGRSADATALGWKLADETNRASLGALIGGLKGGDGIGGLVGDYLDRDDVSDADKKIARELVAQIRDIWNGGGHRHGDGDIYKIAARIGVLTHRIGATPMWNCRSGKDRTGHLDAEMKMLAAEIHATGSVPPFGKLTDERKKVFTEVAMHSGNHEIQRYNTGLPGYKSANMADNMDRLATPSARSAYAAGQSAVPH